MVYRDPEKKKKWDRNYRKTNREKCRESLRKWRGTHRDEERITQRIKQDANVASWGSLLMTNQWNCCVTCGRCRGDVIIHLHHVVPDSKLFNLSSAMQKRSFPDQTVLLEMEKCVPLCRGCHMSLHHASVTHRGKGR